MPDDHPDLQRARGDLAVTIKALGDLPRAKALEERILEVRTRTLPDDHPDLQLARGNLAVTIKALGDLPGAKTLEEKVLEVRTRTLPDDHPDLQLARGNLAVTIKALGDLPGAKALEEKVLEVRTRTLPDDHPDLQKARLNLAVTIKALGDLPGAKALEEKALKVYTRTLPDDHPDLQKARANLAATIKDLGDLEGAKALDEKALEVYTRTLPDDHPYLQAARVNLSGTIHVLGDLPGAKALDEKALEVYTRTLPDDHPDLQKARANLAATIKNLGDLEGAKTLQEKVLEVRMRTLPDDHPKLQMARMNLAITKVSIGEALAAARLVLAMVRGTRAGLSILGPQTTTREAEALALGHDELVSFVLALAPSVARYLSEDVQAEAFALVESARCAGVTNARLSRGLAGDAKAEDLRQKIGEATSQVAQCARTGTGDLPGAVRERDSAQRAFLSHLATSNRTSLIPNVEWSAIASALHEGEAAVGYWVYDKQVDPAALPKSPRVQSYLAYVLRPSQPLRRVELGPAAEIDQAVEDWRQEIGASNSQRGSNTAPIPPRDPGGNASAEADAATRLRTLIFDPLREALGDVRRVYIAPVEALHLVPFDALPSKTGLLGDAILIVMRATLKELTVSEIPPPASPVLVAFGGIDYDQDPLPFAMPASTEVQELAAHVQPLAATAVSRGAPIDTLRESAHGWPLLPETMTEAAVIADHHRAAFPDGRTVVLSGREASRQAFETLAPQARTLHLATHAFFAPESVVSMADARSMDEALPPLLSLEAEQSERIRGFAPMVLSSITFAGANGAADVYGRVPGVMTAEEVMALDLSGCELVVLSACETHVGVRRGGQGIASLQQALHGAGVRTVVTSLWKVPDKETRELMTEFYRLVWIEKLPKAQALWEAKQALRRKLGPDGKPCHLTRDWAGWVLSGEAD
jgi:tetratricopeptide (TPR) repeat protein